ncbi:MAG TPA: hypothetical protein VLW46_00715 [Candidatus Bathyarchaeia archaeon]|nr:hypothetical protein [Candidatus Bathyarchaeia archaeon]
MPQTKKSKQPEKDTPHLPTPFLHRQSSQRVLVTLALTAAIGIQYRLVNMPVADLKETKKFPAHLQSGRDAVSFVDPQTTDGNFAFEFDQPGESRDANMIVDAYFDRAALSSQTLQSLAAIGLQAPSDFAASTYVNESPRHSDCRTKFTVATTKSGVADSAVQFFQSERAQSERSRLVEVMITGYDATVNLVSSGAFVPSGAAQCRINLSVGDWTQRTQGFLTIQFLVRAGSSFRFRWEAPDLIVKGWGVGRGGDPLKLLFFGSHHLDNFSAREIKILPLASRAELSANQGLVARSSRADDPFTISSLKIGKDELVVSADGTGRATENGQVISRTDVLAAITQNPLLALLLTAVNAALIGWARRSFFGGRYHNDS